MKKFKNLKGIRNQTPKHHVKELIKNYRMPNIHPRKSPLLKNWLPMKFRNVYKNKTIKRKKIRNKKKKKKSRKKS